MDTFKRLALVVALTGLGHLISLFFYPVANNYLNEYTLVKIAEYESLSILLISVLGFGINATATRDVAVNNSYKDVVYNIQSSRLTFSLVVFLLALLYGLCFGFSLSVIVFLLSPIFALNYDFILYGVGSPVQASIASFIRLTLPMAICFCLMIFYPFGFHIFIIINVIFFLISSKLVSVFLDSSLLFPLRCKFYLEYKDAALVGFTGIAISFYRFGYLSFTVDFMTPSETIELAFFSKFCLFLVAARRIVIQFFYTQIAANLKNYSIDLFLIVGGFLTMLLLAFSQLYFPSYLLDSISSNTTIIACGIATLAITAAGTSDSKILLLSEDFHFLLLQVIPICVGICLLLYLGLNLFSVLISLVVVELLTSLFNQLYVIDKIFWRPR